MSVPAEQPPTFDVTPEQAHALVLAALSIFTYPVSLDTLRKCREAVQTPERSRDNSWQSFVSRRALGELAIALDAVLAPGGLDRVAGTHGRQAGQ